MRPRLACHLAARVSLMAIAASLLSACETEEVYAPAPRPTAEFSNVGYATWSDEEPAYRLYPGDEVDVQVPSAPELSKAVTVQPDGRVSLPLIAPVMVADRSVVDAEALITTAYASQLLRPEVTLSVRATPLKVFVGGEVDHPGVYDMPGDINALQAVIMAGGFKMSAKRSRVMLIRRGPAGKPMIRTVDLLHAAADPGRVDLAPLRRFDIVYVPKTGVAETGQFVQQYIHDVVPISMGFSYAGGGLSMY
jgi:protein involved in polysaccharide export with SLBB domain